MHVLPARPFLGRMLPCLLAVLLLLQLMCVCARVCMCVFSSCLALCHSFMQGLRDPAIFRFCAIPQIMAIGTLSLLYNNGAVYEGEDQPAMHTGHMRTLCCLCMVAVPLTWLPSSCTLSAAQLRHQRVVDVAASPAPVPLAPAAGSPSAHANTCRH